MDMTTIAQMLADAGSTLAPWVATVVMALIGALFYRATAFLPGFARAYIEGVYRANEARMRDSITRALRNGIDTAMVKGFHGGDVLSYAIDHAVRTNPEAVAHFKATSGMDRQSLEVMAQGLARTRADD